MIRSTPKHLTERYDLLHTRSPRVSTFSAHFTMPADILHCALEAPMFFATYGQADREILGQKMLLIHRGPGERNRVLMRSPFGVWVDVSRATAEELQNVVDGDVALHDLDSIEPSWTLKIARRLRSFLYRHHLCPVH